MDPTFELSPQEQALVRELLELAVCEIECQHPRLSILSIDVELAAASQEEGLSAA